MYLIVENKSTMYSMCVCEAERTEITCSFQPSAGDFEDEPSEDYKWVIAWLERWKTALRVENYSTRGWEHTWDIEAPEDAIAEVPNNFLCASEWSGWTVPRKQEG